MVGFSTMVGFFHIEKYWNFCAGAFFAICCGSICAACCCCQCCESVFKLLLFIWNYLNIWLSKIITTHLQVNEGKDPCHGSSESHQVKIWLAKTFFLRDNTHLGFFWQYHFLSSHTKHTNTHNDIFYSDNCPPQEHGSRNPDGCTGEPHITHFLGFGTMLPSHLTLQMFRNFCDVY